MNKILRVVEISRYLLFGRKSTPEIEFRLKCPSNAMGNTADT